jgi:hypothetical protein
VVPNLIYEDSVGFDIVLIGSAKLAIFSINCLLKN